MSRSASSVSHPPRTTKTSSVGGAPLGTPRRRLIATAVFVAAAAAVHAWAVCGPDWSHPLVGQVAHGFRQSQTAYAARMLLEGSDPLACEVPVLGPPWRVPFEFPFYQWTVAVAAHGTGGRLEPTGRWISLIFYWCCFPVLELLLRQWRVAAPGRLTVYGLLLLNPHYAYWGHSFLIETTALFFSLACVAAATCTERRYAAYPLAVLCGALACAVKVTTFLPFLAVLAGSLWLRSRESNARPSRRKAAIGFAVVAVPALLCGMAWTRYADEVKKMNPLTAAFTSAGLSKWNFGTVGQRLDPRVWGRIAEQQIGSGIGWCTAAAALLAVGAAVVRREQRRPDVAEASPLPFAALCLAGALAAPALFINLHAVHSYYGCANQLWLAAAAGLAVAWLLQLGPQWSLIAAVVCLVATVEAAATTMVYRAASKPGDSWDILKLADQCRRLTEPDEALVIFGCQWSPEIPYRAERRALMMPSDAAQAAVEPTLRQLEAGSIGALIVPNWEAHQVPADSSFAYLRDVASFCRRLQLSTVPVVEGPHSFLVYPGKRWQPVFEKRRAAQAAFDARDFAGAVRHISEALTALPDFPDFLLLRATAWTELQRYDAAIRDCRSAQAGSPWTVDVLAATAVLQLELWSRLPPDRRDPGLLHEAEAALTRVTEIVDASPQLLSVRAQVRRHLGRTAEAERDWHEARRLETSQ